MGIRQVGWDEKVQNLKKNEKKKPSEVRSVDVKQVDHMRNSPNVKYSRMSQKEAHRKQVRRENVQ